MAIDYPETMAAAKQLEGLGKVDQAVDCLRPVVMSTLHSLDLSESPEDKEGPAGIPASLSSTMELRCTKLAREIRALAGLVDKIGEEAGRLKGLITS